MRSTWILAAALALAACGGKQQPAGGDDDLPDDLSARGGSGAAPAPQTELQTRQFAACEQVGPRITECAVADAQAHMAPDELAKLDLEHTAPVHTREFIKNCKASTMSSRQVRVYEVCTREETECGPLLACLDNASPDHATEAPPP